jgi:hypothetical protein
MNKRDIAKQQSNFIIYTGNDGDVNVEVVLKDETVWLTQKAMAGLFGVNVPAISKHLANIYETGELQKEATISILETVQLFPFWKQFKKKAIGRLSGKWNSITSMPSFQSATV